MTDLSNNHPCADVGTPGPESSRGAIKSPLLFERARCTTATRRRSDMMRLLVEQLQQCEMRRWEIQELMTMSPSGVRKYIRELIDFGIIAVDRYEEVHEKSVGVAVFRINRCPATVAKFVASLGNKDTNSVAKRAKHVEDPSRRFHLMGDPVPVAVRMRKRPVMADPLALSHDFFRPVASQGEPMARATVAQVARVAFPMPSNFAFQVPT